MARRIIFAVVITLALLGAARRVSLTRPMDVAVDRWGISVRHRTLPEQVGPGEPVVRVEVTPAQGTDACVLSLASKTGAIEVRPLWQTKKGLYEGTLPDLGRGARMRYAITVAAPDGQQIRLPERPDAFYPLKFKGRASPFVLVSHVAFMFGAFFFMVMALFGAIRILRRGEDKASAVRSARWVLIFSFVGGWPLGFLLNYQTFGVLWEGFPFGRDFTDNKTQFMFVLWLVSLLFVRGSFFGRGEEKDRLGKRGFAWAVVASFIVSLGLFIIPHGM